MEHVRFDGVINPRPGRLDGKKKARLAGLFLMLPDKMAVLVCHSYDLKVGRLPRV